MKKYIEYETGRFSEADEIKKATARIDWKRQEFAGTARYGRTLKRNYPCGG
ncbi:MAG: hypothetical protein ACLVJO_04475 [[Clostridium] scindens]